VKWPEWRVTLALDFVPEAIASLLGYTLDMSAHSEAEELAEWDSGFQLKSAGV
jgi:hypothetical protein